MNEEYDDLIIKKLIDAMLERGVISAESHKVLVEKLIEKSTSETARFLLETA